MIRSDGFLPMSQAGHATLTHTDFKYLGGMLMMSRLISRRVQASRYSAIRSTCQLCRYFVPGSILRVRVDTSHPLAAGMRERTDVFFDNSPVFALRVDASVTVIASFVSAIPLRSGWAWGQRYLNGGAAVIEAKVGKGRVVLVGPEILQRAQPHGTFKLLFNALIVPAR